MHLFLRHLITKGRRRITDVPPTHAPPPDAAKRIGRAMRLLRQAGLEHKSRVRGFAPLGSVLFRPLKHDRLGDIEISQGALEHILERHPGGNRPSWKLFRRAKPAFESNRPKNDALERGSTRFIIERAGKRRSLKTAYKVREYVGTPGFEPGLALD